MEGGEGKGSSVRSGKQNSGQRGEKKNWHTRKKKKGDSGGEESHPPFSRRREKKKVLSRVRKKTTVRETWGPTGIRKNMVRRVYTPEEGKEDSSIVKKKKKDETPCGGVWRRKGKGLLNPTVKEKKKEGLSLSYERGEKTSRKRKKKKGEKMSLPFQVENKSSKVAAA